MDWAPYVPVAKRRALAAKKMQSLKKKGHMIQPIEIQGRTIAHSFWAKAWCEHMESYCDFDNRLPRGRTYVRNGSVCHLEVSEGQVKAIVSGSSLYNVTIKIKPLAPKKWQLIKKACMGKVSSLLDLLSGKLSSGVMSVVSDPKGGLFPSEQELSLDCDCLDYATMCKHVAAVLYGVGARLDADPAQLFKLRGVNFKELIDVKQAVKVATEAKEGRRKRLSDAALTDVFDFKTPFPERLTGLTISKKREGLQLSKNAFAKLVDVSLSSIVLWEAKGRRIVAPNATSLEKLKAIW